MLDEEQDILKHVTMKTALKSVKELAKVMCWDLIRRARPFASVFESDLMWSSFSCLHE